MEKAKRRVFFDPNQEYYTIRKDINTLAELIQCTLNSNDHYII